MYKDVYVFLHIYTRYDCKKKKKAKGMVNFRVTIVAGGRSRVQDSEKHMDGLGGGLIG